MAAEREPPPMGEARPAELEELEDGEDLFTSTVSTLEVRARPPPARCRLSLATRPRRGSGSSSRPRPVLPRAARLPRRLWCRSNDRKENGRSRICERCGAGGRFFSPAAWLFRAALPRAARGPPRALPAPPPHRRSFGSRDSALCPAPGRLAGRGVKPVRGWVRGTAQCQSCVRRE